MDTLIANVTVVTMNERMDVLFGGFIGVTDGKITHIGKTAPKEQPATIIDGTGMVAMPGLVNCHTHLSGTLLRTLLDDESRAAALEQQLRRETRLDSETAKASALLGIAECLRFGVTSVSDMYYYPEATAQAVKESGIRANIALSAYRFIDQAEDFDFETDEQCQELCRMADTWHGFDDGRIRIDAGLYAEYTSNYKLWEAVADYAKEKGLGLQLHLAQSQQEQESCLDRTGLTAPQLLSCHRVFDPPVCAAGCNALEPEDRALLGKAGAAGVALPIASSKAGLSGTDIAACVKAGMNMTLGTDGAVEAGNLDMFQVMRAAAACQRTLGGDADTMPAGAVLMMATVCGARAQRRGDRSGMLKEGMDADVILIDFTAPHLIPCHDVIRALVFCASGGDVAMTMVGGKVLYQNGHFPTIDLTKVVQQLTGDAMNRLFADE